MGTPADLDTPEQPAFDFIQEVMATASDQFHNERISHLDVIIAIGKAIEALTDLDHIKKAIFYNRQVGIGTKQIPMGVAHRLGIAPVDFGPPIRSPLTLNGLSTNMFHAIIGSATEAGEKLELMLKHLLSVQPFDTTNYVEEVGDGLYYDGVGLNEIGMTFEQVERIVIAKLRLRSGKTFSAAGFNSRDLDAERKLLEESTSAVKPALPNTDKDGRVRVEREEQPQV